MDKDTDTHTSCSFLELDYLNFKLKYKLWTLISCASVDSVIQVATKSVMKNRFLAPTGALGVQDLGVSVHLCVHFMHSGVIQRENLRG